MSNCLKCPDCQSYLMTLVETEIDFETMRTASIDIHNSMMRIKEPQNFAFKYECACCQEEKIMVMKHEKGVVKIKWD